MTAYRRRVVAPLLLLVACGSAGGGGVETDTDAATETGAGAVEPITLTFADARDALQGFEHDTGFIPEDGPAGVRARASATASVTVGAQGRADATTLEPIADSGQLEVEAGLSIELSARLDTAAVAWEGVVDTFEYAVDPASTGFDPFLLDAQASVVSELPAAELARVPIGGVPGATLIATIEGGSVETAFAGVCASIEDSVAHYTGELTVSGTVDVGATIEVEVPLLGTETFGPFALTVPIPATTTAVDLGAFSVPGGQAVDGGPCDGTAGPSSGSGDDGGMTGGAETGGAGTSGSTGGTGDSGGSDSTGSDPTGDPTGESTGEPPQGCDETCDGCCLEDTCFDGWGDDACGYGGACEVCEAGETCDGYGCVMPADCTSDADCEPGEVCIDDACSVGAWDIRLLSGEIATNDWDTLDEPDPYVTLESTAGPLVSGSSETLGNTLLPNWDAVVIEGAQIIGPFSFEMWDADGLTPDDLIGSCEASFPPSAFGGTYEVECEVDGELAWTAVFALEPA